MATKITKVCDVCGKEYSERDYCKIPTIEKTYHQYSTKILLSFYSNDPAIDSTERTFQYDLCPNCAKYIVHQLKIYPK